MAALGDDLAPFIISAKRERTRIWKQEGIRGVWSRVRSDCERRESWDGGENSPEDSTGKLEVVLKIG